MGIPESFPTHSIFEEMRESYCLASAIGFGYYSMADIYHSPKGFPKLQRFDTTFRAAGMKFPKFAGCTALFTGMFSTVEYGMEYLRKKDDPLNQITAGVTSAGLLTIRHGPKTAALAALLLGPAAGMAVVGAKKLALCSK